MKLTLLLGSLTSSRTKLQQLYGECEECVGIQMEQHTRMDLEPNLLFNLVGEPSS